MVIKQVKRFSLRIFNAVLKLLPQLGPLAILPTAEHLRKSINSKGNHFFIAEMDNEIVGMMTVVSYIVPGGTKFWIEDVVVDESYRGKGIGKGLILKAIDFAGTLGVKQIDLTSRPFRKEANELYKKLGFELRQTNVYRYTLK